MRWRPPTVTASHICGTWRAGSPRTFAHPGSRGVIGVAFDPDGELLAAADGNGRAYLWDLVSGELARTFVPRHSGGLNDVAFCLGGDLLAAAGGSGRVYLWDVVSGKAAGTYIIPGGTTVYAVAFARAATSWPLPAARLGLPVGHTQSRPGRRIRRPR